MPLWGSLSDRFGRKKLYMAGAVFSTLFAFPFFTMVDTKETVLVWLAMVLGVNVGHDLMYGPQAAFYSEMFGTRVRYSGASLGYQLASVLSGGFAPLIAAALLAANDDDPTLVAIYMVVMGVITIVATAFARETYRRLPRGGPARGAAVLPRGRGRGQAPAPGGAAGRSLTARPCCAGLANAVGGVRLRLSARASSRSRISRAASPMRSRYSAALGVGQVVAAPGERVAEALDDRQRRAQGVDERPQLRLGLSGSRVIVVVAQRDLAALERERDRVHAVARLELADHVAHVGPHGLDGHVELVGRSPPPSGPRPSGA